MSIKCDAVLKPLEYQIETKFAYRVCIRFAQRESKQTGLVFGVFSKMITQPGG